MSGSDWVGAMTRRRFVVTALTTGFALAVRPIAAETISTPSTGLQAGEIQIPTPDGHMPAYRARPTGEFPAPVILVVQEIFGVHEHIKDICRRLARLGYLAIAPELYARHGDVSRLTDIDAVRAVVSKVSDQEVLADLDAAVAWVKASGEGDSARVGVTGFCWGGRIVWLYAAHSAAIKAGVAWYGRLIGKPSDLQPRHPIDVATSLKAPVLGLYGAQDQGIPVETVEQMQHALQAANSKSEIVLYPNAPHGFHADYRPSYRKEPAEDGWRRMTEWFEKHGVRGHN